MQQVAGRAAHARQAGAGGTCVPKGGGEMTSVPGDRIKPSAINCAPTVLPSNTIKGPQ
jgi:hypothetical protein